ncbi:MAG: hypothetical protein RIQ94_2312 [Pseudomonadota bacterium]|jgi:hypothetical protein
MTNRLINALWCDDIRQEIDNKLSLMGIYTNGITIPSLPIVLPRLAVYVKITTAIDNPFKKLILKIIRDDGFILATLQQDTLDDFIQDKPRNPDATKMEAIIVVTLNSIEIPEGCKYFQILAETESESLDGSKLRIDVNPDIFPVMPNNNAE